MNITVESSGGVSQLDQMTARDLMKPNPSFIRGDATDEEAIRVLADRGITAIVVVGESGRPEGVMTATDVLIHQREKLNVGAKKDGPTLVRDMMTPAVFSVRLDTPARQVVEQMVAMNVHRLFVVDESDVVVGVISALNVLRHLV